MTKKLEFTPYNVQIHIDDSGNIVGMQGPNGVIQKLARVSDNGNIVGENGSAIIGNKQGQAIQNPITMSTSGNGATSVRTTYGKQTAERKPNSVFFLIQSYAPITLADWKFAVAATDEFQDTTNGQKFRPMINNVEYNADMDTTTGNGWALGDFTTGVTGTTWPGSGDSSVMYVAASQPVQLRDLPRRDGGSGRVFVFRVAHINASTYSIKNTSPSAGSLGDSPQTRKYWLRTLNSVDGIADLTQVPVVTDDAGSINVSLCFDYGYNVRSVWFVGDSITANFEYNGWAARAAWAASTPEKPIIPHLLAKAGAASKTYLQNCIDYSKATGIIPTDIVVPIYSPNGDFNNDFSMDRAKFNFTKFVTWARQNRIRLIVWDGMPNNGSDALRQSRQTALRAWAKELLAAGMIYKYVEMAKAITSNYGSGEPERYTDGTNSDATHPTQPSTDLLWPIMANALLE